jgi:hypothetical protein
MTDSAISPAPHAQWRDVSRSSRYVGRGMRWTLRRQAGSFAPDENAAAYGEIVWSWRRDPGATLAVSPAGNGGKKGRSPGRVRISRRTIARGKPGCPGCTCQTRVRFLPFCTRCCGRSRRPAFPAPSSQQRDNELAKLRRDCAVRTIFHVVTPAKAGAHTPCRQEKAQGETTCFNNCARWLWAPAFAGATAECVSPSVPQMNVTPTSPSPSSSIRT